MCGIVGIYAKTEKGKSYFKKIEVATLSLSKRGPDAQQNVIFDKAAFGHARLSIIDTSTVSHQPLTDATGKFTIIFNGEIYNYQSIKNDLIKKGFQFNTQSDTEVLLNSFIDQGEKCLDSLNGFFAFAIYNHQDHSVFIARDRMGIKPLHIFENDDVIVFGSEMKSLIKAGIDKRLSQNNTSAYFKLNYLPPEESIFEQTRKLAPGSFLHLQEGTFNEQKYFQLNHGKRSQLSYTDAQKELKKLLFESVEKRMVADVPLGSFLSGGTDSSIIAGLASTIDPQLNTFSIGYADEPLFDETEFAEAVAKKFKTNHHVFKLKNDDLLASYYDMMKYIDEPFADSSAIAVNLLTKYTKNKVTVALSGDGADELFTGYNKHRAEYWSNQNGLKQTFLKACPNIFQFLPQSRNSRFGNLFRQLDKLSKGIKKSADQRYWDWASWMDDDLLSNLLVSPKKEFLTQIRSKYTGEVKPKDMNSVLLADQRLVLQGDMLTKVDLMSMNNSLEVRVPFLDHQLVNFVNSLPESYKINDHLTKRILQETYQDFLPEMLFNRKKHGFEVPLLKWFNAELKSEIDELLLNESFIKEQNIFNYPTIQNLVQKNRSNNPGDSTSSIWALLVFQNWYKNYYLND